MLKTILLGLMMMCMLLIIPATTASAISIDVNVVGIFDSTFAPKGTILPNGDFAIAFLNPGDVINIEIIVDNAAGAVVTTVVGTIIFQGNELAIFDPGGFGGTSVAEILVSTPPPLPPGQQPTSLTRIAQPAIKINSPNPEGTAGDVWLQATAFAGAGTSGTGPDQASSLFFTVLNEGTFRLLNFDFVLTAGDVVNSTDGFTVNNAAVGMPEPGTALLVGLGLAGLAFRRH